MTPQDRLLTPQEYLQKLYERSSRMQDANYAAAVRYGRLALITGYPSAVLSGVTASTAFVSFFTADSPIVWVQIVGIVTALITAFAVSSDRYFSFDQKNKSYRKAGATFANYKRDVENMIAFPPASLEQEIKALTERWDEETKEFLEIPDKIYAEFKDKAYSLTNGHGE